MFALLSACGEPHRQPRIKTPMEPESFLDPLDFLRDLYDGDIRYLLVGRQALALLGAPLLSADYDFYLAPGPESLESLLELASTRNLEVSPSSPHDTAFLSLLSDNLKLDFFHADQYVTKDGEPFTFDELYQRRKVIAVDDFAIYVPALEDLLLTKKTRLSPKDREDIKYIQVLLEREQI